MYAIRFTIRKSSNQRKHGKHAYLKDTGRRFIVGNYDGALGSAPIALDEATRYESDAEATQALIRYLQQIERWDRKMWVRNPVIVEVD